MLKRIGLFVMLLGLVVGGPLMAQAQPEVYAVLFFSPTCGHCHDVITNHLPGIQATFGDQLHILFVDVTTPGGQTLVQAAYQQYAIPEDRWVVPMMIVDERVLTGSTQIPQELPGIIRTGLDQGGIGLPTFPGLREAYAQIEPNTLPPARVERTLAENLAADPLANALAIAVLLGLSVSLVVVIRWRRLPDLLIRVAQGLILAVALGVAITLVLPGTGNPTPPAWGLLILWLVSSGLFFQHADRWLLPLVVVAGLLDAAYLTYIELTQHTAVCGAVGNCNAVQQSAFAQIMGVPIGVIGLVGYAVILVLWLAAQDRTTPLYSALLLGIVLIGTVFSIYLTFLEPFVIGATCAWCLLSALTMLMLLWLVAPSGWQAIQAMRPAQQRA